MKFVCPIHFGRPLKKEGPWQLTWRNSGGIKRARRLQLVAKHAVDAAPCRHEGSGVQGLRVSSGKLQRMCVKL